jgi:hypothetical protein
MVTLEVLRCKLKFMEEKPAIHTIKLNLLVAEMVPQEQFGGEIKIFSCHLTITIQPISSPKYLQHSSLQVHT